MGSQEKEMDPAGNVKVQFQVDPFFRKRSKDRSKALGSKAITTKEDEPLVCRWNLTAPFPRYATVQYCIFGVCFVPPAPSLVAVVGA